MGLLVVNASAIAAVIFGEDERASVARRLAGQLLLAPSLIAFELMNIAVKRCRAGLLTPDQASASFAEFSIFGVELHEIDMALCLRAVLEHGLTAYDASYLLLARITGAESTTLDRRLLRAASNA